MISAEELMIERRLADYAERAAAAEAALAERDKPCVWTAEDDGWYTTRCERAYSRMQDSFCPGCGHPIDVQE